VDSAYTAVKVSAKGVVVLRTLWLLLMINVVWAKECPDSLRLAYNSSWLPYIDVQGQHLAGQDITLLHRVADQLQLSLKPVKVLESRALQWLQQGQVDLVVAASFTAERANYAWFSTPYRQEANRVLVHSALQKRLPLLQNQQQFFSYAQQQLTGAFNPTGFYGDGFLLIQQNKVLMQRNLPVYESLRRLELVLNQRVDYAVMDQGELRYLLAKRPDAVQLQELPFVLNQAPVHFILSKASVSEACFLRFNQVVTTLVENETPQPADSRH